MKKSGFTLIELMIVVAIIAIIAAIAIPNLLRSRMAANEASAIGSLRTISSAQIQFQAANIITSAPGSFGSFTQLFNQTPPFIDAVLGVSAPVKSGYGFVMNAVTPSSATAASFTATADPLSDNTGTRHFFVDESGLVTFNNTQTATAGDNPLQ